MRVRCGNTVSARHVPAGMRVVWILILALSIFVSYAAHAEEAVKDFKPDEGWLASVQRNIEEQEYRPSKQTVDLAGKETKHPKWHINNRAQGFRSAVSRDGWEIVPRPPAAAIDPKDPAKHKDTATVKNPPKWYWRYKFSSISRGNERKG